MGNPAGSRGDPGADSGQGKGSSAREMLHAFSCRPSAAPSALPGFGRARCTTAATQRALQQSLLHRGSSPRHREATPSVLPLRGSKAQSRSEPSEPPRPRFTPRGQCPAFPADSSVPRRNVLWICRRSPEYPRHKCGETDASLRNHILRVFTRREGKGACPRACIKPDPSGHSPVSRCSMTDGGMKSRAPRLSGDGRLMMTWP